MSIALTFNNLSTVQALAILKAANLEGAAPAPAMSAPAALPPKTSAPAPTPSKGPPPKPAPAAPPPPKKKAAAPPPEEEEEVEEEEAPPPKKGKKAAPVEEEEVEEEAAADEEEVDPKLISAKKLKDVLAVLMDQGITDVEDLKAECARLKEVVPVLSRIAELDARIDRTLEVMDMGDDA